MIKLDLQTCTREMTESVNKMLLKHAGLDHVMGHGQMPLALPGVLFEAITSFAVGSSCPWLSSEFADVSNCL